MMGWTEIEAAGVIPNAGLMDYVGTEGATAASNAVPVVMTPSGSCYINYVEGSSSSLDIEPPFYVGGRPYYVSVSGVYSFIPMPSGLSPASTPTTSSARNAACGVRKCRHSRMSCSKCFRANQPCRK